MCFLLPSARLFVILQQKEPMSDGNFNRALLPSTPYRSGVKMGQQQMKTRAVEALELFLIKHFPTLADEERHKLLEEFRRELTVS